MVLGAPMYSESDVSEGASDACDKLVESLSVLFYSVCDDDDIEEDGESA